MRTESEQAAMAAAKDAEGVVEGDCYDFSGPIIVLAALVLRLEGELETANAVAETAERYTGKRGDRSLFELCVAVKAWKDLRAKALRGEKR